MIPILFAVFVLAAVTKAPRPRATAREFAALGLPWPRLLARAVPVVELGVAGALVVAPPWGAAAATALLGCFTVLLATVVRSGRTVSCGCLGALDRRPVGRGTVLRNLFLTALAVTAMAEPGLRWPPVDTRTAAAALLVVVPAGLIVLLAWQLGSLRHTVGRLWSLAPGGEVVPVPVSTPSRSRTRQSRQPRPTPGNPTGRNLR